MNTALPLVLVVDDDAFTAELAGMVLEEAGYGVILAEGGGDALEKLAANPAIRLIVSDMNMPFMDGIQLFAELREQGHAQPFVLLTGESATPLMTAHPDLGAVLAKDERLQETLPATLAALLSRA